MPRPSLFGRLSGLDQFGLFLTGFIVLYGAVSLLLEHVVGVIGFAKTPYLNAGGYLYAMLFVGGCLLTGRIPWDALRLHPLGITILISAAISAAIGFYNANALPYIGAWSLYVVAGVVLYQVFRHRPKGEGNSPAMINAIYSLPFLGLMLAFDFLSMFNRDNHYQYVLFEVVALYGMALRPGLVDKLLSALLYLLIHLGSNEGYVEIEINRASILAVGATALIFLLYKRYILVLALLVLASIGGIFYALTLDDPTLEMLPRNVREAIQLMKGDDLENHVSSFQRVYEGRKVMEDFDNASPIEWAFGKGLGRTIDMTGAADTTVGQHALLGVKEVHNIHFLHFAILHKFGMAGILLVGILGFGVAGLFVVDLRAGRLDRTAMFFYFYLVYNLIFAVPASNFLIANPLWPAFLGMLVARRHQRVGLEAPQTPPDQSIAA